MANMKEVKIIPKPDGTAIAVPHKVYVSKKGQEEVCWVCHQGDVTITFVKGSPFTNSEFHVPLFGSVCSGPPINGEYGVTYKYNIIVTIPGDPRKYYADPEVEVDP